MKNFLSTDLLVDRLVGRSKIVVLESWFTHGGNSPVFCICQFFCSHEKLTEQSVSHRPIFPRFVWLHLRLPPRLVLDRRWVGARGTETGVGQGVLPHWGREPRARQTRRCTQRAKKIRGLKIVFLHLKANCKCLGHKVHQVQIMHVYRKSLKSSRARLLVAPGSRCPLPSCLEPAGGIPEGPRIRAGHTGPCQMRGKMVG